MQPRSSLPLLLLIFIAALTVACGSRSAAGQGTGAATAGQLPAPQLSASERNSASVQSPAGVGTGRGGAVPDQPPFDLAQAPKGTMALRLYSKSRTDDPLTFAVAPGSPFEGEFGYGNYSGSAMDFVLLCLVDYTQTPCLKDRDETTQRFALKNGEQTRFDLALDPLAPGLHDLVLVVFFRPDTHDLAVPFRQDSRFMYMFRRVNLLVGDSRQPPAVKFQTFDQPDTFAKQGMNILALTQHKSKDPWAEPWLQSKVATGQPTSFTIWANNIQPAPARVAIVALLDYQQVALADQQSVLYGELAGQSRADLAGSVAPATPGPHEFLVLLIENPFIELALQAKSAQPLPFFVTSSGRVLLDSR